METLTLCLLYSILVIGLLSALINGDVAVFDRAYMYLSPKKLRTPMDITIEFRTVADIPPHKAIVIALPRFTRNFYEHNSTFGNFTTPDLLVSPSYMFKATFVEGHNTVNTNQNGTVPYADSHIIIRSSRNVTISAYSTIPFKIHKENGIGAICGFASSEATIEYGITIVDSKPFKLFSMTTSSESGALVKNNDDIFFNFYDGIGEGCTKMLDCNGHGKCDFCYETCQCEEGYGASTDITPLGVLNRNCVDRVCPYGKAIGDLPTAPNKAHAYAECSNQGICDRKNGTCNCFPPYAGAACERMTCPRDCSGHGKCLSLGDYSRYMYRNNNFNNKNDLVYGTGLGMETIAWDYETMHLCVCDSAWEVGFFKGERQLPEYFGPDCSLRRCPSGDDPFTSVNETNCQGKNQYNDKNGELGKLGNLCQVDCSNRGVCDYKTGTCNCFSGSWGNACERIANTGRHALESAWDTDSFALANGNDSIIIEGN